MTFSRTPVGQANEFLFYPQPIVWVEGDSDVPVFESLLSGAACVVKSAGGKPQCWTLAGSLIERELPYVVVMDGDYEVLTRKRSPHRRVVFLDRHSIENYFLEIEPIEVIARRYAQAAKDSEVAAERYDKLVQEIETKMRELIALDVAACSCSVAPRPLPKAVDAISVSKTDVELCPIKIRSRQTKAKKKVSDHAMADAQASVSAYLGERRLADVVRGHFIFSAIRKLITVAVKENVGRRPTIDNRGLRALFAPEVWRSSKSRDHRNLRRRVKGALADARKTPRP